MCKLKISKSKNTKTGYCYLLHKTQNFFIYDKIFYFYFLHIQMQGLCIKYCVVESTVIYYHLNLFLCLLGYNFKVLFWEC